METSSLNIWIRIRWATGSGWWGRGVELKLLVAICHSFGFICFYRTVWRHEQTYTLFWLVDMDWMHLEVGLKWACWLCAWIFKVKVSREIAQFSPCRTRTYAMPHATVTLTAQYLKLGTIIIQTVRILQHESAVMHRVTAWGGICAWELQPLPIDLAQQ